MGTVICPNCGLRVSDIEGECFACGSILPKYVEEQETNIDDYYYEPRTIKKDIVREKDSNTDVVSSLYIQEKAKLQAQADFEREQTLIEQKKSNELADLEHKKKLDEIPIPKPYGDFSVYVKLGVASFILVLFTIAEENQTHASIVISVAVIIACVYGIASFLRYKDIEKDIDGYKEKQLSVIEELQNKKIRCPKCHSEDVTNQVFQENKGSSTTSNTSFKIKEKGHGCLWWLIFGWWWWIIDIFIWCIFSYQD